MKLNMKTFLSLVFLTLGFHIPAYAGTCGSQLQAFTEWEMKVKGEMVPQIDYFSVMEWDPNSQFDGLLLSSEGKGLKRPIVEVAYASANRAKKKTETFSSLKPFERDSRYQQFVDFHPREFFTFDKPGTFTLTLKDGDQVICTESHPYNLGH